MVAKGFCQCTPHHPRNPYETYAMVNCFSTDSTTLPIITFPQTKKIGFFNIKTARQILPGGVGGMSLTGQAELRVFTMTNTPMEYFARNFLQPGSLQPRGSSRILQLKLSGNKIGHMRDGALKGNDWTGKDSSLMRSIDISNNNLKWLPKGIFDEFMQQTGGYNCQINTGGNPWINEAGMCKCKNSTRGVGLKMKSYRGATWCECDAEPYGQRNGCTCLPPLPPW